MKLLFASDSFKETISSDHIGEILSEEAGRFFPDADLISVPIADGGEGTVEAVISAVGGCVKRALVHDPLGKMVEATYGFTDERHAIIEMATASGLALVDPAKRDPLNTSTFGTGELISDALDKGATSVTLAIGGSATNDGGMGAMKALGATFFDEKGNALVGVGADLSKVVCIDLSKFDSRVSNTKFYVMNDVNSPLTGVSGATQVFGPQKGANADALKELEQGMLSYAKILKDTFGLDVTDIPGAGAAGGLGAACITFLHAEAVSGIEQVLDLIGFDGLLNGCDICITGEGHADAQSVHGKVVSGVALRCKKADVPCIAIVGAMSAEATELLSWGVTALVPTVIEPSSASEMLCHADQNYRLAAQRVFSLISIGMHIGDWRY